MPSLASLLILWQILTVLTGSQWELCGFGFCQSSVDGYKYHPSAIFYGLAVRCRGQTPLPTLQLMKVQEWLIARHGLLPWTVCPMMQCTPMRNVLRLSLTTRVC